MKENSKVEVSYDGVLTPTVKNEIEREVKQKYGDVKVEIIGKKMKNKSVEDKKAKLRDNNFADIYTEFLTEKYPEITIEKFLELDGEISKLLPSNKKQNNQFNLKNLKAKNLLSFAELELDLAQRGLVRIFSKPHNMGGKSNLTRIIKILLFGEFYRSSGERTTQDKFLHKHSPLNYAFVEGEVEINDETFFVRRDFTKGKSGKVSQKLSISNQNGNTIDNDYYESLVGDIKTFLFVSYFDTFSVEKWLNTKPTERYRLFVNYFGLQILEEKFKTAKRAYDDWFKNSKTKNYQHLDIPLEIKNLEESIAKLIEVNEAIFKQKQDEETKKQGLLVEQNRLKNLLKGVPDSLIGVTQDSLKSELNTLALKITDLDNEISSLESAIVKIDETVEQLNDEIQEYRNAIIKVSPSKKHTDELELLNYMLKTYSLPFILKEKLDISEKRILSLRNQYTEINAKKKNKEEQLENTPDFYTCTNCKIKTDNFQLKNQLRLDIENFCKELNTLKLEGLLEKTNLGNIQKEIEGDKFKHEKEIREQITSLESDIQKYKQSEIAAISEKIHQIQSKLNAHQNNVRILSEIESLKIKVELFETRKSEIKQKIKYAIEFEKTIQENSKYENLITQIQEVIESCNEKINQFAVQTTINNLEIERNKKEIEKYENILMELKSEIEKDILYRVYLEIHSKGGLSMQILSEFIQEINEDFTSILNKDDFIPFIKIEDDSIEFEFIRDDVQYNLNEGCGYEKTMTSLCLHYLALNKMDITIGNVFIMDEIFSSIGKENLDKTKNVLDKMLDKFKTILLITHHDEVGAWADESIKIIKTNNISKVI